MSESKGRVMILKDGPYLVRGSVPLVRLTIGVNAAGESVRWEKGETFPAQAQYALCRCGASRRKPFCDGAHARAGFDGTETASREPYLEQADWRYGDDDLLGHLPGGAPFLTALVESMAARKS